MTKKNNVFEILHNSGWNGVEGEHDVGPFLLRHRVPVLQPSQIQGYGRVVKIVWTYADGDTGAMPTEEDSDQMAEFKNRFCEAVDEDGTAILTAVLTFDGARQWVYYTDAISECGKRLHEMPQNEEPYPFELTTEADPRWNYLRNEILNGIPLE